MAEIKLTKENFHEEVKNTDKPMLIDFWASWCGPCRMLSPIIEEIANEYAGTIKVGKVNVDEEPELAQAFGVSAIPMLVVIKNGEVVNTTVGYQPKASILALL